LAFNNIVCVQTTGQQEEMSTALRKHKHIYCSVLVTRDLKDIKEWGQCGVGIAWRRYM